MNDRMFIIKLRREMLLWISLFFFLTSNVWINILNFLPISSIWFTILLIYIPLFLFCILEKKTPSAFSIAIFIVSVFLFAFSYYIHPENAHFFTRATYGIERVFRPDRPIYVMFILSFYKNPQKLLKVLWSSSLVILLYGVFEFRNAMTLGYWEEYNYAGNLVHFTYSLSFGYKILLPCLIFGYMYYLKKDLINAFLCIVALLMIFIGGSRGQLLCIFVFIALLFLKSYLESKSIKKLVIIVVVAILTIVVAVYGINNILAEFSLILQKMGMSSRTIDAMLTGNLADDNSRLKIWKKAVEMINEGGFLGYGVYGDRPVISTIHYAGYCHNIFLEIMVCFGKIPGLFISAFLIFKCITIILKAEHNMWYDIFIIFFSISCQLLLSMSFWYVTAFWCSCEIGTKCVCNRQKGEKI